MNALVVLWSVRHSLGMGPLVSGSFISPHLAFIGLCGDAAEASSICRIACPINSVAEHTTLDGDAGALFLLQCHKNTL